MDQPIQQRTLPADEHEPVSHKAEMIQKMLPWHFESKLAIGLGVFKIPLMILVAVVGMGAESHIKEMTERSWLRYGNGKLLSLWGKQTGCYAIQVRESVPHHSLVDFGLVFWFGCLGWCLVCCSGLMSGWVLGWLSGGMSG